MLSLLIFGIIILIIGAYVRQTNKGSQRDLRARLGGRSMGQNGLLFNQIRLCQYTKIVMNPYPCRMQLQNWNTSNETNKKDAS